jgi:hypothetical protein
LTAVYVCKLKAVQCNKPMRTVSYVEFDSTLLPPSRKMNLIPTKKSIHYVIAIIPTFPVKYFAFDIKLIYIYKYQK